MDDQQQFSLAGRNRLSDRDMLMDLIITEKYLSRLYDQAVLEAISPSLAETFERLQADAHDNARTIFAAMQQRGWYNPARAQSNGRVQRGKPNQTTEVFAKAQNSKYAVSSGSQKFGGRLSPGHRMGKSGIFNKSKSENYSQNWQ
jgi:hypothetical protein